MTASLIIPVGIPGCGKSTYAKTFFNKNADRIWSTDSVRAMAQFCGDATDQSKNDEVFKYFHGGIYKDLMDGFRVFADATNLTTRARETLVGIARVADVPVHLIVFTDCNGAIYRNQNRERVVPPDAMFRMLENYEHFRIKQIQETHLYDTITEIGRFT